MKRMYLSALLAAAMMGSASAVTLVYGSGGEPVSLESGNITDGNSIIVQRQIYDTLVGFRPGTTTLDKTRGLASNWTSNANATQWTFTLRRGVKFHDGTDFNADAVLFNVNRWWDEKDASGMRNQGRTFEIWGQLMGGYKGQPNSILKSVTKVNDYTVRFDLNTSSTVFPDLIASGYFGIASPKAVREQGARYGTPNSQPVGTGPFTFDSWKTGDRITLKRNANYWGSKAKVDDLVIRFIKDPSARLNELRAGTIDFTVDLTPDNLNTIKNDQNLQAVLKPSFNVGFVSMNVRNQYFKNEKVRQAVSMAINKPEIVKAFWNGLGVSNASFLPPVMNWANSKNVPADYKFDPQAAKKMLADAGYPNGFSIDLWYMPVSRPYFPNPKPIAEAIAADLSAIGIKANLKTEDWGKYLEDRKKEPGFDMYMIGWTGDYGDPDNFYSAYYGSESATLDSGYKPAELEKLLDQGRAAVGQEAKAKIYAQVHDMTYNAAVRIPVVHSQPLAAARSYVKGWTPSPLGSESFNTISVEGKR
ncbi:ABC transporter substrate-binding protein [Deinococcus peraridilitoris]|uniref:ABC-type dipeptide transport system, periplasmic component n=1 Tax=Deinococcus peraridilitoris (strain DSM 19664 / LMG 22246 / CIP 109416 / KR-200) TaxID=937777 RepID=K9ZW90_DEIPD|nr:ABC transporter substrate-binding protein [Deinococcus peraridilitoris]AFZ65908.1 ABC-type dipeptide transport system, periplasmic component [Deinococcus peraridilitoris DSM 19664]